MARSQSLVAERAYDAYLRALAHYEAEPRGYRTASMYLAIGRIRLEQGDPKAAERRFMAASADIELMPEEERWGIRGRLELEQAKLAWDHHQDHAGAREHAQRALEYVRRVDPEYREELEAAVEAWLAEH